MPTVPESLATAVRHHQEGRLPEAEQIYKQILLIDPHNIDACHLLGVMAYQTGRHQVAIQYLGQAIDLNPDYAEAHYNLANALYAVGRFDEAVSSYSRATQLKPHYAEAHNNLGNAYHQQGKLDDAAACYRRVLELRPDHADAHFDLGNILNALGKLPESVASYLEAIKLRPAFVEACVNAGIVLQKQRQIDAAILCFRQALKLDPGNAQAHYCLGLALFEQDNAPEAIVCYRRALEANPYYADVWNNLGIAHKELGQLDDAVASYRRAAALTPAEHKFHCNLAIALQDAGKHDEAETCFQQALKLKPDSAEVHWNWSHLLLLRGDFQHGWAEYEWRWKVRRPVREFCQPTWDGQPLNGQTILLHAEQGFGDTFQFIRYASLVKSREGIVMVECQRPLTKLLASCPGIDRLIAQGDAFPSFDVQAPLLSLPGIFKSSLHTIPASVPYLSADPRLIVEWREKLKSIASLKVGIAWQGSPGYRIDRERSIKLASFAPLASTAGVSLVSLQKGGGVEQLASFGQQLPIVTITDEFDESAGAFMDTAAIMKNLDLVIAPDTAIAHLAGALGVPVWVALSYVPDWRWMFDRPDSPWYPTMRLFRQKTRGDWAAVFDEMHSALRELADKKRTS